ncbi:hypothetical protein J4447_03440 [Candidatus Pacearchaeota archaeon]|nr:hypothetical protein [Candidatus Pacearchaeota archaeon]
MLLKDILQIDIGDFFTNLIFAAVLIVAGVILGTLVNIILKKMAKKGELDKARSYNFIKLFIMVITWSIYLLFLNFALVELNIPVLTGWLSSILLVIPSLTGALILIVAGFAIATYLKNVIEESRIEHWKILANIFWFFVLYIFTVFAFKTALISINSTIVNWLIVIMSGVVGAGLTYHIVRKK